MDMLAKQQHNIIIAKHFKNTIGFHFDLDNISDLKFLNP